MAAIDPARIRALTFDVFGTVVDWRTSVAEAGRQLARRHGIELDEYAFAEKWRGGYSGKLAQVNSGQRPRERLNDLHREILAEVAPEFGLDRLPAAELDLINLVWHRLRAWPDSVHGLWRLRQRYLVCALSNGDSDMLATMGKSAGLGWDMVISVEMANSYKPQPAVYNKAIELVGAQRPDQVLMVAAHASDLRAARACGMQTAFVRRPSEWGPGREPEDGSEFDLEVPDLVALAVELGI